MKSIKGDSENDDLLESSSENNETSPNTNNLEIDDTKLSCLSYQPLNLDHLRKLNDKNTVRSLI